MARKLTPEALYFIQQHHHVLPETDVYACAETIVDAERPFYGLELADEPRPGALAAAAEEEIVEAWLRHAEPELPVVAGPWPRLVAILRRVLWPA